ncbi:MAG: hypothetical protein ACOYLR_04440 [Chlorobium sp.]
MKLIPDAESRKRLMKHTLRSLLGIAWSPIIGLVIIALFGNPIALLIGWQSTFIVCALLTLLATVLFVRVFNTSGKKINGKRG